MAAAKIKTMLGACAAALAMGAATQACADVTWYVEGVFDDGGTLSGHFTINVYGWLLNDYELTTTDGSEMPGFVYTKNTSYYQNGTFYLHAQPGYQGDLHLTFANPLGVSALYNPMKVGDGGQSYECQDSWNCYIPKGDKIRYFASGRASTSEAALPEPSTWGLMILGFGAAGGALRATRRRERAA
jgi:hypothetical protein